MEIDTPRDYIGQHIHIVRELRQILFTHTLALVVPVFIAIDPCSIYQNVPLYIILETVAQCAYTWDFAHMLLDDDEVYALYDRSPKTAISLLSPFSHHNPSFQLLLKYPLSHD